MYKTSDMTLAIALVYAGEQIKNIVPAKQGKPGKMVFLFNETDSLNDNLSKFLKEEIQAPVQNVVHISRELKATIKYAQRGE